MAHYVNIRDGMGTCKDEDLNSFASDLLLQDGIVWRDGGNYYKVKESSPVSKDVVVTAGKAWVRADYTDQHSDIYQTHLTADKSVTIDDNISGNTRIDSVVIAVDLSQVPDAEASNVATVEVLEGAPAGSPSALSDAEIQTALGANVGWLRLADITVENAFTGIDNSNITSKRMFVYPYIADKAVTNDKIADKAVTNDKLADKAVTNDKLARTSGHLVFTPDANKLVKVAVLRRDITTNSYVNNSVILTGWTYVQGNNDSARYKDISFGITFSAAPIVLVSTAYKRQEAPPASISHLTSPDQRPNAIVGNISTTGFRLLMSFGYVAPTNQYHGATWIAIGQLS